MIKFSIGDKVPSDHVADPEVAADLDDRHLIEFFGVIVSMHDFDADPSNIPAKPKARNCLRCA